MNIKDLILTPFFLIIIYSLAYYSRPFFTNKTTHKYFIPALTVKILGAISLGIIYQFYYGGGDTFNYYYLGKIVYNAFFESPVLGFKLLASSGEFDPEIYKYSSQIYWFESQTEYTIVKLSAFFGLFCANTYSVIAILFACSSFTGIWALYNTLVKIYPALSKEFAISVLFIPSVFFWGSGITKDAITLGSLGWLFYGFYHLLIIRKKIVSSVFIIIIAIYLIKSIKIYILLSFIPPVLLWVFLLYNSKIKIEILRILLFPFFISIGIIVGITASKFLAEDSQRYNFETVVDQATVASNYHNSISKGSNKVVGEGNSGYDLGDFDGSIQSLLELGPKAIVIGLFRPFIWEINSPIMLLSALESSWIFLLTLYTFGSIGLFAGIKRIGKTPLVLFCIIFSIIFALGTGLTSGNFGNLVRYRIPMLPFFVSSIFILKHANKTREPIRNINKSNTKARSIVLAK